MEDKKFTSLDEMARVASSIFVAVYEGLFNVKIKGVVRKPKSMEDFEINAQRVINNLEDKIQMDLAHISGAAIAQGDLSALTNLVNIFISICFKEDAQMQGQDDRNDQDSISTHESTFEYQEENFAQGGGNVAKMLSLENQMLTTSADKIQKLCEEDARQIMLTTEARINQEERIEAAKRRRDDRRMKQERRLNMENKRKKAISHKMQQARWLEENQRESKVGINSGL